MRVISGLARGTKLQTLEGVSVRPTTEKVKEAIFSAIQFDIEYSSVLDLFAGSGQMGIEALSRGAKSSVFVDNSDSSIKVIKNNLSKAHLEEKASVLKTDYSSFLATCKDLFDIIILDPPYYKNILFDAANKASLFLNDNGIMICEHPTDIELPDSFNECFLAKRYKYGKIYVSLYRK